MIFINFVNILTSNAYEKKCLQVFSYLTDIKTMYLDIYFNSLYYIFDTANNTFIEIDKIN